MSRRARRPAPQAVHFRGVSQPRLFSDAGEVHDPSTVIGAPRPSLVHRFMDDFRPGGRPFPVSGYGADQPHVAIRRRLGLPVTAAVSAAVRSPVRSPASLKRIASSWHAFNALKVDKRVRFCVQRHQRRQVLHALGIAGRRGLGRNGVRRSENSNWRCA